MRDDGGCQHHAAGLRKGMQRSTTPARFSVALDELSPKVFQGGVRKICADQYAIFRSGADLLSLAFGGFTG